MATSKTQNKTQAAQSAEANGEGTVTFTVVVGPRDTEIELTCADNLDDVSIFAAEYFEKRMVMSFFREVLGEVQYTKLAQAGCTSREFSEKVFPVYQEAVFGVGEA